MRTHRSFGIQCPASLLPFHLTAFFPPWPVVCWCVRPRPSPRFLLPSRSRPRPPSFSSPLIPSFFWSWGKPSTFSHSLPLASIMSSNAAPTWQKLSYSTVYTFSTEACENVLFAFQYVLLILSPLSPQDLQLIYKTSKDPNVGSASSCRYDPDDQVSPDASTTLVEEY